MHTVLPLAVAKARHTGAGFELPHCEPRSDMAPLDVGLGGDLFSTWRPGCRSWSAGRITSPRSWSAGPHLAELPPRSRRCSQHPNRRRRGGPDIQARLRLRGLLGPLRGPARGHQGDVEEAFHPGQSVVLDIRSELSPFRDGQAVLDWFLWRLSRIEAHEVREWTRWRGIQVSDPHAS